MGLPQFSVIDRKQHYVSVAPGRGGKRKVRSRRCHSFHAFATYGKGGARAAADERPTYSCIRCILGVLRFGSVDAEFDGLEYPTFARCATEAQTDVINVSRCYCCKGQA